MPVTPQAPGLLADGIARFTPAEIDPAALPRSFALDRPWLPLGPVPPAWTSAPQFRHLDGRWVASWRIGPGTSLYGTGEVAGPLLRNGFVTEAWAKQPFRIEEDGTPVPNYDERSKSLYQAHPWVLALRADGTAFGILADTTYRLEIDLRQGIRLSSEAPFPVIVIEGEGPQTVLRRLAELTGRIELPPRWTLGYHQCRFSYYPDARVREIADEFRSRKIPCDVIWVDIHYMDAYKVFTFDPEGFPDPSATNAYLHGRGFRSVWILDPAVKTEPGYSVYDARRGGRALRHGCERSRASRVDVARRCGLPGLHPARNAPLVEGPQCRVSWPRDGRHLGGPQRAIADPAARCRASRTPSSTGEEATSRREAMPNTTMFTAC